ncbi:hypothetical protein OXPF_16820 [Oxobacter pfennigii]|uniref:Uncharacterized protein n=1 Tax=Oxobacter pfennigii TaxID=36849 RepID=A0A0P8YXW0_9CLOT|nr:hypothetical protein [Oxobacter pfennigii]KPU44599.1 hypothetical protein OXPF_16820 [Oxobacter pfennigii]
MSSFNTVMKEFPLLIMQVIDMFYKISLIIALFYATKALRLYIDKNSNKQ